MKVSYSFYTNAGKVRQNNEDALLVIDRVFSEENFESCKNDSSDGNHFLFAVADGMGGHRKGELASRLTLESLLENKNKIYENPEDVLRKAKKKLDEYAMKNPSDLGLGCAVAGLVLENENGKVFNVGDCRVYRFINNKLIRLTKDHSVVESLLSMGLIDEIQAKHHPEKHILTSFIVGDPSVEISDISVRDIEIYEDDVFLICSDGFWNELPDDEIKMALSGEDPSITFLELLSKKPLNDNISFILIRVEEL